MGPGRDRETFNDAAMSSGVSPDMGFLPSIFLFRPLKFSNFFGDHADQLRVFLTNVPG